MRMLMWLLLAVLVIFALRKKSQNSSGPMNSAQTPSNSAANSAANDDKHAASAETMLCCERCQVYFPASEAIMRGEKIFCCAAHADQT